MGRLAGRDRQTRLLGQSLSSLATDGRCGSKLAQCVYLWAAKLVDAASRSTPSLTMTSRPIYAPRGRDQLRVRCHTIVTKKDYVSTAYLKR